MLYYPENMTVDDTTKSNLLSQQNYQSYLSIREYLLKFKDTQIRYERYDYD